MWGGGSRIEAADIQMMKTHRDNNDGQMCRWVSSSFDISSNSLSSVSTKLADTLWSLRPVGLSLNLTPSFLDLLEKKLYCTKDEVTTSNYSSQAQAQAQLDYLGSQQISEKLKASNFSASLLKIGSWQRVSRNEGDVVAKCYYGKKKLVWEILEGRLKRKIEIQWSDILSIEAKIQENKPGILHIELNRRPAFYEETDPQPRKHTMWKLTTDFTRGEAYKCRRHYLVFPPGSLDKPYDKLLQCDERLRELSSKPFPSLPCSPNFPDSDGFADFSFGHNAHNLDISFGVHFAYSTIPSPLGNILQPSLKETPSPVSVMDFAHSDEHTGNQVFENPRMDVWSQGKNTCGDTAARGLVQLNSAAPCQNYDQVNPTVSWQNYTQDDPTSDLIPAVSCQELLSKFENHLFSDSESACLDENYGLARVGSWAELINLAEQENPARPNASMHSALGHANGLGGPCYQQQQQPVPTRTHQVSPEIPMVHPPFDLSSAPVGYFHQQNDSSMLIQASPEISPLRQPYNNFCSYYTSSVPDRSTESFGSVNFIDGVNSWS